MELFSEAHLLEVAKILTSLLCYAIVYLLVWWITKKSTSSNLHNIITSKVFVAVYLFAWIYTYSIVLY